MLCFLRDTDFAVNLIKYRKYRDVSQSEYIMFRVIEFLTESESVRDLSYQIRFSIFHHEIQNKYSFSVSALEVKCVSQVKRIYG